MNLREELARQVLAVGHFDREILIVLIADLIGNTVEIAACARAYRAAEQDGTPRMWRGKELQDLANDLDDALEKVFAELEIA